MCLLKDRHRVRLSPCYQRSGVLTLPNIKPTVKAYEIYQEACPSLITEMLQWVKENEKDLYQTTLGSLAENRKLRPIFVQKKSFPDQIQWLHKTLKLKTSDVIGEHLFQIWLMKGQQDILIQFCDLMEIPHDGKGSVEGALPEELDATKLETTIHTLLEKHDPKLVTLYLAVFNLQTQHGWKNLTEALERNDKLSLV